jgi:uncharacterized protein
MRHTIRSSMCSETLPCPWRETAGGIEIAVRLTPRGGRDGNEGISAHDGFSCLKVKIASPPVDGAANRALIAFLAKSLGVARSGISLVSGEKSRLKRLRVAGEGLGARLESLLPE